MGDREDWFCFPFFLVNTARQIGRAYQAKSKLDLNFGMATFEDTRWIHCG